jgi:predicted esterase
MMRLLAKNGPLVSLLLIFLVLPMIVSLSVAHARQASYDMPNTVNSSAEYLFFLHNYYVEKNGPNGDCKYYDLLNAFADSGFSVISEVRSGKIIPCEYAEKIIGQIRTLLDAGVPPEKITVAGHSKGGVIALCVSSKLGNPKVNFVVMAGCEIKPLLDAYPDYRTLKGRFLSIYASSDPVASSCYSAFSQVSEGISSTEIRLESEGGHSLFFKPETIWLNPVILWNRKGQP